MAENLDVPGRFAVRTPDAMDRRPQRRFLDGAPNGGSPAPFPTVCTVRTASTPPTSAMTTSPSGGSCETSSTPTGSSQRSAGRRPRCSKQPNPAVLPTCAGRNRDGRWSRCTTSAAEGCIVPIQLADVPAGSVLVDLLHGLAEHELDAKGADRTRHRRLRLPVAAPAETGRPPDHLIDHLPDEPAAGQRVADDGKYLRRRNDEQRATQRHGAEVGPQRVADDARRERPRRSDDRAEEQKHRRCRRALLGPRQPLNGGDGRCHVRGPDDVAQRDEPHTEQLAVRPRMPTPRTGSSPRSSPPPATAATDCP